MGIGAETWVPAEDVQRIMASYRLKAEEWVRLNPFPFSQMVKMALGAKRRGRKVGFKCVWEVSRYIFTVRGMPLDAYCMNNSLTAYVARIMEERVPELAGYFEKREAKDG